MGQHPRRFGGVAIASRNISNDGDTKINDLSDRFYRDECSGSSLFLFSKYSRFFLFRVLFDPGFFIVLVVLAYPFLVLSGEIEMPIRGQNTLFLFYFCVLLWGATKVGRCIGGDTILFISDEITPDKSDARQDIVVFIIFPVANFIFWGLLSLVATDLLAGGLFEPKEIQTTLLFYAQLGILVPVLAYYSYRTLAHLYYYNRSAADAILAFVTRLLLLLLGIWSILRIRRALDPKANVNLSLGGDLIQRATDIFWGGMGLGLVYVFINSSGYVGPSLRSEKELEIFGG